MGIIGSLIESLNKNKKWVFLGAALYLLPIVYRLATKNSLVPILDTTLVLYDRGSQITPLNIENLRLIFAIPSAVGALVGASFLEKIFNRRFAGVEKYVAGVFGSVVSTLIWISVEFIGYSFFNPVGVWGNHLWAGPTTYARNLIIALTVGPILPYVIEFAYGKIKRLKSKR